MRKEKGQKTDDLPPENKKTFTLSIGYTVAYTQSKEPKAQNLKEQGTESKIP